MRKIVVFEIGKKRRKNSSWYVFCLQLRDLTQENLNRLVGIVTEDKYVEILTEYCAKGSLADILENDSLKLDWPFRFSLISDIINVIRAHLTYPLLFSMKLRRLCFFRGWFTSTNLLCSLMAA